MPQHIDTRIAFYRCGVDFGADAKVILVSGLNRLVWMKGTRTLIGIRGRWPDVQPYSLELRTFKFNDDRLVYDGGETLLSGGRLSKPYQWPQWLTPLIWFLE